MGDNREQRNNLAEMKVSALGILERLHSNYTVDVQSAMQEYVALVDRFYQENEEMVAPQQYEVAKKDFEYFLRLLDLAIAYYREEG